MKSKRILFIAIGFVICAFMGCDNKDEKESKIDEYLELHTSDTGIFYQWDGKNYANEVTSLMETTDAFYKINLNGVLERFDKSTDNIVVLCSNPECEHNDEECSAHFEYNYCSQVYNGKVYADSYEKESGEQKLLSMNLDGTDRKEVVANIFKRKNDVEEEMSSKGVTSFSTSIDWYVVNNEVYVATAIKPILMDRDSKIIKMYIDVYSLETGEYIKALLEDNITGGSPGIQSFYYYEGYFYMKVFVSEGSSKTVYLKINKASGEKDIIDDVQAGSNIMIDDMLIYRYDEDSIAVRKWGEEEKITSIELTDTEKKYDIRINIADEYICILPYRNYYSIPDDEVVQYYIKIYDRELNYIDMVKLEDDVYVQGGHNHILLMARNGGEYFYFDKEQLGTGNVEIGEYSRK